MTQATFSADSAASGKPFANVSEAWQIYDTVLIGGYYNTVTPNQGYFQGYGLVSGEVAFFNVRNRSHGVPYNNQDARDQLPYVMHIYAIGVSFFAPSTSCYAGVNPIATEETLSNRLWQLEIPKHASVSLRTNQDERLVTNALMVPSGQGPVGGGVAAGDNQAVNTQPAGHHASFSQGGAILTNCWGFQKPLEIPRTASMSVVVRFSQYAQNLMDQMTGPNSQPMKAVANDTTNHDARGCSGIQVFVRGRREVQQRGQYHA